MFKKLCFFSLLTIGAFLSSVLLLSNSFSLKIQERKRSSQWNAVRIQHLQTEPYCAWDFNTNKLEVHHIIPFHVNKELELALTNLITLCRDKNANCHFRIGHFCDFQKGYNVLVRDDCNIHSTNNSYIPPEFKGQIRKENEGRVGKKLTMPSTNIFNKFN